MIDPTGAVTVPYPRGLDPVTDDNRDRLRDELLSRDDQVTRIREAGSGGNEILRALDSVRPRSALFQGERAKAAFTTDDRGRISGAISWVTNPGAVSELKNLGALERGSGAGTDLFNQFMRDAAGHGSGARIVIPKGAKGFFTKKLRLPDPGKGNFEIVMTRQGVTNWLDKRKVPRTGGAIFNRGVAKPVRDRARRTAPPPPKPALPGGEEVRRVDVEKFEDWKPAKTKSTAIKKLKRHFDDVRISSTITKNISSEDVLKSLNIIDAEIVRMKNVGAMPSGIKLPKLSYVVEGTGGPGRLKKNGFAGQYAWLFTKSFDTARGFYRGGVDAIKLDWITMKRIAESIPGDSPSSFSYRSALKRNQKAVAKLGKGRFTTSASTGKNSISDTFRHEIGHAVSIPQERVEQRPNYTGPRPYAQFSAIWKNLQSGRLLSPKQLKDKGTPIVSEAISFYAGNKNAHEFYAEAYAMIYAEGFPAGTLDKALKIDGFELLIREIAETVQ